MDWIFKTSAGWTCIYRETKYGAYVWFPGCGMVEWWEQVFARKYGGLN